LKNCCIESYVDRDEVMRIPSAIEREGFWEKIPFKIQQDARVCIALIQPMVWLLMGCEDALPTDLIFHWFQEIFFFDFIFALWFLKSDNLFEHTYFLMRLLKQNVNFICTIIY
jgi:hypothetical protein